MKYEPYDLLNMYEVVKQALYNRHFEYQAAEHLKQGMVNPPIYLSVGTEFIPPLLMYTLYSMKVDKCHIFTQHRCHSYFLTLSQNYEGLVRELCGKTDGCNEGYGGSASLSHTKNTDYKMWGHSGLLGDQIPIACGAAHASQELTICVLGDAAAEEDYALAAFGYAITKKTPILFICEDNNLSLLTTKAERRSWDIVDVVKGMGLKYQHLPLHTGMHEIKDAFTSGVESALDHHPAFINIEVYRHLWHAGAGQDGPVQYDWYEQYKKDNEFWQYDELELAAKDKMEQIWLQETQSKAQLELI